MEGRKKGSYAEGKFELQHSPDEGLSRHHGGSRSGKTFQRSDLTRTLGLDLLSMNPKEGEDIGQFVPSIPSNEGISPFCLWG